jgi:hypothetical protein
MSVTADLRACLERIDRPLEFCSSEVGPTILPGLRIEGLGMVALPLDSAQAGTLEFLGSPAGYGRGRSTVIDPKVRRVLRFAPDRVQCANPAWEEWLADVVERLAKPSFWSSAGILTDMSTMTSSSVPTRHATGRDCRRLCREMVHRRHFPRHQAVDRHPSPPVMARAGTREGFHAGICPLLPGLVVVPWAQEPRTDGCQ